jgi:hypothetical protein
MSLINKKVKLNLVGLDGNAFSLLGAFSQAAHRQGWTKGEINTVRNAAMSGDYDNLLRVLTEHTDDYDDEDSN